MYSKADLYLLDDPLSAVDASVASSLMDKAIVQHLSGTTRILVTHQLRVLSAVDQIIYLDNETVAFHGSVK